jgi:NitT/TauT family transport system permease protein
MRSLGKGFDLLLLAVAIAILWQALYWLLGDVALASPRVTVLRLAVLLGTERFWLDISETLRAILAAAVLAIVIGVSLGVVLGVHRRSGRVAEPILATLYSLPKVTLYPVVLLLFGLGISARIAFGVMHGVLPITLFAMNAIRNIGPTVLRTARTLQLTPAQAVTTVFVPAALPGIMTGVRIGVSVSLLGVLLGEMFASKRGLGFRLMNAIGNQDIPSIMAIALLLSIFALSVNALLILLGGRIHRRA